LAVLGLTVYTAAFVCETVRSGVNTVPLGQAEAARSLGLTFSQNLRIVLLPQAFRAVIIPLGSVLIALTKNTTIASAIGSPAALLMKEMIENTAALVPSDDIRPGFVILTLPTRLFFAAGRGWRWAVSSASVLFGASTFGHGHGTRYQRVAGHALVSGWCTPAEKGLTAAKWNLLTNLWKTYICRVQGTLTAAVSIVLAVLGFISAWAALYAQCVRWVCSVSSSLGVPVLVLMIFAPSCTHSTYLPSSIWHGVSSQV
jgi:ABC-type amino acid transport system permease subunit